MCVYIFRKLYIYIIYIYIYIYYIHIYIYIYIENRCTVACQIGNARVAAMYIPPPQGGEGGGGEGKRGDGKLLCITPPGYLALAGGGGGGVGGEAVTGDKDAGIGGGGGCGAGEVVCGWAKVEAEILKSLYPSILLCKIPMNETFQNIVWGGGRRVEAEILKSLIWSDLV
jgi:hypothetical protein